MACLGTVFGCHVGICWVQWLGAHGAAFGLGLLGDMLNAIFGVPWLGVP